MDGFTSISVITARHLPQKDADGNPWTQWWGNKLMMHPDTYAQMRKNLEQFQLAVWIQQTLLMRVDAL